MKRVLALALTVLLLLTLAGCGGDKELEIIALLPGAPDTLDPQTCTGDAARQAVLTLFEGLCRVSPEGKAVPGVARRWEADDAGLRFTFHLRDAAWSDGSPVTAQDFVYGITRALSPEVAAFPEELGILQGARAYHSGEASADALGVSAPDDHTLEFTLTASYPDFPLLTAGIRFFPCQEEFFHSTAGHYGQSAEYLLTNGPFTFAHDYAWYTDYGSRKLSLVRSSAYRGEHKPRPTAVTLLIDYDDALESDPVSALAAGSADLLAVSRAQVDQAEAAGCKLVSVPDGVLGLALNQDLPPFTAKAVRSLFLRTPDRQALLAPALEAGCREAVGLMPPGVLWAGEDYYAPGDAFYPARDETVTQALPELLSQLKLERLPAITVLCPDDQVSIGIANRLLRTWNDTLGSSFNMLPLPEAQLRERVADGDYEAALYTLRAEGATPLAVLRSAAEVFYPPLPTGAAPRPYDFSVLLRDSDFSLDSFRSLESALAGEELFVPLLTRDTCYAMAPGVEHIAVSPDGWVDLTSARK